MAVQLRHVSGKSAIPRRAWASRFALVIVALLGAWLFVGYPIYSFPPPVPFEGTRFLNPYGTTAGTWLKANFHAHSRAWGGLTDGRTTQADLVRAYEGMGYDVIGLSNYWRVVASPGAAAVFPAYEHGANIDQSHHLVVGAHGVTPFDYPLSQNVHQKQFLLDLLRRPNEVLVLAHPGLRGAFSLADMASLTNYDALEAVSGRGRSLACWDAALSAGRLVWVVAGDDTHDSDNADRTGICWTMVRSRSTARADVLDALRNGHGYAVEGHAGRLLIALDRCEMDGATLRVATQPAAQTIRFVGQGGKVRGEFSDTAAADYTFQADDPYIRVEIAGDRTRLYLNPVLRTGEQPRAPARASIDWPASLAMWLGYLAVCGALVGSVRLLTRVRLQAAADLVTGIGSRIGERHVLVVIAVSGAILFVPWLGSAHLFDWDEINFAEAAREMLVLGDYLRVHVNFAPFWEKPPLFIWLQAASMAALGVNEFAARLPNALVGIATLLVVYRVGRRLRDRLFGLLWATTFACSFLPSFYFRSGIIDPLFNLLMFLSVERLARGAAERPPADGNALRAAAVAGAWAGGAVLTKGPVGLLLPLLTWGILWLATSPRRLPPIGRTLLFSAVALVAGGAWFAVEFIAHGPWFIRQFFAYQVRLLATRDAGHGWPFYFHPVVLLIGCYPASVFAIAALRSARTGRDGRDGPPPEVAAFRRWMIALMVVVVTVFSIVQTKIVHYSSLAYFPITFLAASFVWDLAHGRRAGRLAAWANAASGMLLGAVFAALPLALMYRSAWMNAVSNPFVRGNLAVPVTWTWLDVLPGACLAGGAIACVRLAAQRRPLAAALTLFATAALGSWLAMPMLVPKVERHVQGAAINFYEGLRGRDCYVATLGLKSYAVLFYPRLQPSQSPSGNGRSPGDFERWLLEGNIDRPAYFVCRVQHAQRFQRPGLVELSENGGFAFFRRDPTHGRH